MESYEYVLQAVNFIEQNIIEMIPKKVQGDIKYYDSDELFKRFKKTEEFSWLKAKNYLSMMLKNKFQIDNERFTMEGKKIRFYGIPDGHLKGLVDRYNLGEIIDVKNIT